MSTGYHAVRALERGLDLLVELNRTGPANASNLSLATGMHRTTVIRLLKTLERKGYISQTGQKGCYGLTLRVRQLSEGFNVTDYATRVVAPELAKLVNKIKWPSDFATFENGTMLIRDSTHRMSPLSVHRSMIGRTRPVTSTALGRAVLAHVDENQREAMLELVVNSSEPDREAARDRGYIRSIVEEVHKRGYAWGIGGAEQRFSGIALPVLSGPGQVLGAVNIIFFRTAFTPEQVAEQYLDDLRAVTTKISSELNAPAFFPEQT